MAALARNIAGLALLVSIVSLQVPSCTDPPRGTTTASASAQDANFGAALQALLALAGMQALFVFAAIIYSHRQNHAAGNWLVSEAELAFFILCLQVGFLQLFLFVQQPGGEGGAHDGAPELAVSAARALPAVASVTFFLGIALVYGHVGNDGGGAGGAIAGNGPVPAPAGVRFLANLTFGAVLACLTSIVLAFYTNTK